MNQKLLLHRGIILWVWALFSCVGIGQDREIEQLLGQAEMYYASGEYHEAIQKWTSAWKEIENPISQVQVLKKIGNAYLDYGETDSAEACVKRASGLLAALPDTVYADRISVKLLDLSLNLKRDNYEAISTMLPEVSALFQASYASQSLDPLSLESRKLEMQLEILKGRFWLETGQYDKSKELYIGLLEDQVEISRFYKGRILQELGLTNMMQRDMLGAYSYLKQSEEALQDSLGKDHPALITTYSYLGFLSGNMRNLLTGRKYAEAALDLYKRYMRPDHQDMGVIYYNGGGIYDKMGESERAAAYFQEAIRIEALNSSGISNRMANYYMSLASALRGKRDYVGSVKAHKEALRMFRTMGNNPFLDQLYANIGLTYMDLEDYDLALQYLDSSLTMGLQNFPPDHRTMVYRYKGFGDCYLKMGQREKALTYYQKAIDIEARENEGVSVDLARIIYRQGRVYREMGDIEKSLDNQDAALAALKIPSFRETGTPYLTDVAREYPAFLTDICSEIGMSLRARYQVSQDSVSSLKQALEILLVGESLIDSTRNAYLTESSKLALAQNSRTLYETALAVSFDLYAATEDPSYLETAFRLSEKSKALLLLLGLKHAQALEGSAIPVALLELERSLEERRMQTRLYVSRKPNDPSAKAKLDSAQHVLLALNTSRDSLIQVLEQQYPDYYYIKYTPQIPTVAMLQQRLLDEKQVCLAYFQGEDHIYGFKIDKAGISGMRRPIPEKWMEQLNTFRASINAPMKGDFSLDALASIGHELYEVLIASFGAGNSKLHERIMVIPDGRMSYLSFDIFLEENVDQGLAFSDFPFLLKNHDIGYIYSAGVWQYLTDRKEQSRPYTSVEVLAFQPEYEGSIEDIPILAQRRKGFGPLYFSQQEVEGISQFFPTKVLNGKAASEESFYQQAALYPIIHISSHAQVPESNPEAAFIAFTNTLNESFDDSLTLEELYTQRLNADLVVLSACETGVGQLYKGEGIMSLGRGFTYSGASSLVMSLWEVNDASTADIMTHFYKYLAQGMSKDASLRQAKLDYLKAADKLGAHPYFWASFVAMGDLSPLPKGATPIWPWVLGALFILFVAAFFFRKRKASQLSR